MSRIRTKLANRLLEAGWLAIALLVPLTINPWGQSIFSLPKAVLLRTVVVAMLAVWIVDRLSPGRSSKLREPVTHSLAMPVAALLLAIAAATFFGADPALSFWGSHDRALGALTLVCLPLLTLVVAARLAGPNAANRLFWCSAVTVIPLAAYGAAQYFGLDPLDVVTDARSPVGATLGRSNFLAAYLAMVVPLTLTLVSLAPRPTGFLLATILGIVELALLVATQTRGALLAALVGVACWTALVMRRRLRALTEHAMTRGAIAVLAAVAIAAGLSLAQAGGSGAARLAIWQGVQRLIVARPLLGYGPDALGLVFPRVYPPELVYYQGRGSSIDRAHNLVLDWTVTLGVLGLFAGAAFLAVVLRSGWRTLAASRVDGPRQLLVIGSLSALAANLTGNLVSFDVVSTLALSGLLAGVIVALESAECEERGDESARAAGEEPEARREESASVAAARSGGPGDVMSRSLATLLVVLTAAVAVWFLNFRPLIADVLARHSAGLAREGELDRAIAIAERSVTYFPVEPSYRQQLAWLLVERALDGGEVTTEDLDRAERLLEEAIALRPDDFLLSAALARFHGDAALRFDRRHFAAAERAWKRATRLAPNHGLLYLEWAKLLLQAGDQEGAARRLRKAVDLDATDAEAWLLLADLELGRGQAASALEMYRQAARHAPERPESVLGLARAYWILGEQEAALESVDEALELDPSNLTAMALREEYSAPQVPTVD